jgi:hypothetical protein
MTPRTAAPGLPATASFSANGSPDVSHRCETGLIDGEVAYRPEPLDARATGYALTCCSRPLDDIVLDL